MLPRHARTVCASRVEPLDSLDYFPTPPWATRALFVHVLGRRGWRDLIVDEPACGEGHMAYALEDYFGTVRASDIFGYGYGEIRDFLAPGPWRADEPAPDWIITNPPFREKALAFVLAALKHAKQGVGMFVGTRYVEGVERYELLYRPHPPTYVAHFVERVPLHKERWLPDGDTQTAYTWLVWQRGVAPKPTFWIPPVCRATLCYVRDIERFGVFE